MDRGVLWATVHRVAELDTPEATEHARMQGDVACANFQRSVSKSVWAAIIKYHRVGGL